MPGRRFSFRGSAGMHYRSDIVTDLALGRSAAQLVIERAKTDGADASTR